MTYDKAGNLIEKEEDGVKSHFSYDGLYQLKSEQGAFDHHYHFDSLYNRRSRDGKEYSYNALHQLLSAEHDIFSYDPNGNRISKGTLKYRYDALNRLISAGDITYTYDALGRLITRTKHGEVEKFLYFQEMELGTEKTLRILGKGTAAIEKDGALYTVLRDHRGSVCKLLDPDLKTVGEYNYNAFGENDFLGSVASPWQYSAQRVDPDTGLVHFPKRVYDPKVGRWLTPDPLGFADGPNLYAYVHNNPLTHIDPLGLYSKELKELSLSFGRGYASDTTWGLSDKLLGDYTCNSTFAKVGYGVGVATSIATGLMLGTTEAKVAQGLYHLVKRSHSAYTAARTGKSVLEAQRVMKLTKEGSHTINKISRTAKNTGVIEQKAVKMKVPKGGVAKPLDLDALSNAGKVMDRRGLTKAGRSLDKHGNRFGSVFPKATGNPSSKNIQGQWYLDDILTHPQGRVHFDYHKQFGEIIDVKVPSTGGARFYRDGKMIGFLEP